MNHTTTHSYVTVPVTVGVIAQVAAILEEAGYEIAVERDNGNNITLIDMHGLALTPLLTKEEDFTLETIDCSTMEYMLTPRTEQAFEWLEKEYPKAVVLYHGASLLTTGAGLRALRVIDKIQKAGMTIDLTQI
jgi:hypothetical protein